MLFGRLQPSDNNFSYDKFNECLPTPPAQTILCNEDRAWIQGYGGSNA